jgi:hypothetical protein
VYNIPISVHKCLYKEKMSMHIQGETIYFPKWLQCFAGVLSQENSCTQASLDMFQLAFTLATNQIIVRSQAAEEVVCGTLLVEK